MAEPPARTVSVLGCHKSGRLRLRFGFEVDTVFRLDAPSLRRVVAVEGATLQVTDKAGLHFALAVRAGQHRRHLRFAQPEVAHEVPHAFVVGDATLVATT